MEKSFWLDGPNFYENAMVPDACMIFPAPVGILKGEEILEGLKQAPRWQSVDFTQRAETSLHNVTVLAYKASGRRNAGEPYLAFCSSSYVQLGGEWILVSHQQTPDPQ
ncbi:DUF4440 domain-containing protein [Pseudooceanicola sp. C21-150M6]|uniref:DUF4440 domain-containing protein n=1 Tax=Pseudooceanicola sp. C21-150M6 TaxID=3434355 RepID=UPI003D7F2BB8